MELINEIPKTSYPAYNGKLSNGNNYEICDITRVNGATHKKESLKTDIYLAKISDSDSIEKNYIGFELEYSKPITPEYYNAIAENYFIRKDSDLCTYIGVLGKNSENSIETVFNSKVSKKFLNQYTQYLVNHPPKLPPKFVNCNNSIDEYDGVDQDGKFFKITEVDKICKDTNGTYLYTSNYIDSNKKHFSIIFESDARIQDIPEYNLEKEITGITKLFTISSKDLSSHSLNYIGRMFSDGLVKRDSKYASKALNHELKKLQKEF